MQWLYDTAAGRGLLAGMAAFRELARAKINLDLHVLGRRPDGYHEVDSLIAFTAFGDTVDITAASQLTVSLAGPFAEGVPVDDDNLVLRAARAFQALTGSRQGAALVVTKNIPVAAGLGGGSADAGATLRGLCRLWQVAPPVQDLLALATSLGADVPACVGSRPVRGTGTGTALVPLALPAGVGVVLVNPRVPLPTAVVFRALHPPFGAAPSELPARLDRDMLIAALAMRRNDLETPAISVCPVIANVLAALRSLPSCRLARMSGSGASCFGLFADGPSAAAAAARLTASHPAWWVQATVLDTIIPAG